MGLCAVGPRVKDGSSASSTGTPLLDSYNPPFFNMGRKGLVLLIRGFVSLYIYISIFTSYILRYKKICALFGQT